MTDHLLYSGCSLATMDDAARPYGFIEDGAVVVAAGRIAWCGTTKELPAEYKSAPATDLGGRLVTPALIDCHTHLVYGGDRAREFELRLNGASYAEISRQGGGIAATVNATRDATDEALLRACLPRVDALIRDGVGVIEVKSGYGLTIDDEIRMLRVARQIAAHRPVAVKTTWLAAHAIPPEYQSHSDLYINEVVLPGLEKAHTEGLVDAVDGFCETIAFTRPQIERVFEKARALGLPVKLHAEQLSDQKGALLVAKYEGLSADHVEFLAEEDVAAFAASGAVAVLLPGAFYILRETQLPPIDALRQHGVPLAVATDANPGSSPIFSLLTIMNMACTLFRLTPEEALAGVTKNAAKALGIDEHYGTIAPGKLAELAVWDVAHPAALSYEMGRSPLWKMISHRRAA